VTVSANGATASSWTGVAHVQAVPKNVEMRRNVDTEQGAFIAGPPKKRCARFASQVFEMATKAALPSVESLVGPDFEGYEIRDLH
jgi:hypothetical protein